MVDATQRTGLRVRYDLLAEVAELVQVRRLEETTQGASMRVASQSQD